MPRDVSADLLSDMQCTEGKKTGDDLDESDAAPLGDLVHVAVVRHLLDGGVLLHEPVEGVEDSLRYRFK